MSYMVLGYGSYDAPETEIDIDTEEEAMEILHEEIKDWCDKHNINIEDTGYYDSDDVFDYGKEEKGVCIIAVYQVPLLKNDADQCLWNAKIEMEKAYFASENYKWKLMDDCVIYHTLKAQNLINKAMEFMGGWQYEN